MIKLLEKRPSGIDVFRLSNDYLEIDVMNFGCTILKMKTKDKNGFMRDVVLGYDYPEDYAQYDGYLGALVGRTANRIKNGRFTLNDKEYILAVNNGPNSLHGGIKGFSYVLFDYEIIGEKLKFHYLSKDMEEGYPGNLKLTTTYELKDDTFVASYEAESDKDTIVNITNHTYFNLNGIPSRIDAHELRIDADFFATIDKYGLVTGEFMGVEKSPFDFRTPKEIGKQLNQNHEQLIIGKGYDHPFVFSETNDQVTLYSPITGIELNISTNLPQAQIYSANYLDGRLGKNGIPMYEKYGICIETQMMPNDINLHPNTSTTILKKGKRYESMTSYQLRVR